MSKKKKIKWIVVIKDKAHEVKDNLGELLSINKSSGNSDLSKKK